MLKNKYALYLTGLLISNIALAIDRPTAVASYNFNNTLNPTELNAFPLTAIDPISQNRFLEDIVFGQSKIVYRFDGNTNADENSGLALKTTGLFTEENPAYSLEMLVKFDQTATNNGYITLFDTHNRQQGNSLFITPNNQAIGFSRHSTFQTENTVSANTYHHIIITVEKIAGEELNHVTIYLNGEAVFNNAINTINLNQYPENPEQLIHFFADAITEGADFSDGHVALIRLYNQTLSADEVTVLNQTPFLPLPTTENECTATFSPEGVLSVPCVSVPEANGTLISYQGDLSFIDNERPFAFQLTRAAINTNQSNLTTNQCMATFTSNGLVTLPCVTVQSAFTNATSYQATLQLNSAFENITFSLIDAKINP